LNEPDKQGHRHTDSAAIKKNSKSQEIAERFSISLRTVYRDIKTLEEAGIPVAGEAGVGYSIMEGYHLPPVMFTKEEGIVFLTALAQLTSGKENTLDEPGTLRNGEKVYSVEPKADVIRMSLSQIIHHRAQLGVFLRLLDVPIPGACGPSADESF
jgi:predicted DNA-binding transcriptional regulator YafY